MVDSSYVDMLLPPGKHFHNFVSEIYKICDGFPIAFELGMMVLCS